MDERRTKVNFYTNVLALIANVFVGIYYTPYLVNNLGLAAYGILPLALIINQYISVATQTLTHAYTRFYSVALQKGDYDEASKDISTSFIVVLLISFCIIPFAIWIVHDVDSLFQIPDGLEASARILFTYTILSFICSLFSSLFNVTLYAINRLDLMNLMKIVRAICKLAFVVLLFECLRVDVSLVGLSNLLTELLILVVSIALFFRFKPRAVRVSFNLFNKAILFSILGMSVWVLLQVCGDTLLYRTDNLIVNHFWGPEASGALGAISEIGSYVTVVVSVIGSLFGPLILMAYAKGDHDEVKSLFIEQSTIVGCLSALLTGIISGCGCVILRVWLGNGMEEYNWWLVLKMVVLPYYAAGGIMAFVYRSWNKVKFPAIGTLVLGLADILTLILLCKYVSPDNAITVLIVNAIFSISQCFILNAVAVSRIYNECKRSFIAICLKITITFVLCYLICCLISTVVPIESLIQVGVLLVSLGVCLFVLVAFVILNKTERRKLLNLIK